MARFAVVFGLVLIAFLAGGCPRKIEDVGKGGIVPTPRAQKKRSVEKPVVQEEPASVEDEAVEQSTDEAAVEEVGEIGSEVEAGVNEEIADGPTDGIRETPGEETTIDEEIPPNADLDPETDVIDEESVEEDAQDEPIEETPLEDPKFVPKPPKVKLSREAVRFAGSWQAVVYDFSGESENATGERFVMLGDSGSFEATALNPAGRLESGIWGMKGDTITIYFGPAGEVEYLIDQPEDNIAIWHGPSGGAMFCIRLPENTTALSPGERYESVFGPVEFSRSGPGYWKGSYGDPEGNLVLQNAGQFLYGTWEQGKQSGYAILEFNKRGFTGYWWYSGQSSFGGQWDGELQK